MQPVRRVCSVCGRKYYADPVRLRHGRQTTCSRVCSYKGRAAANRKAIELTCSVCSTKFARSPSQIKSKHNGVYCSRKCQYRGRGLGLTKRVVDKPYNIVAVYDRSAASKRAWRTRRRRGNDRHSESVRERLRISTARRIARSPSRCVSKLENKVAKELRRRRIWFRRQALIRDPSTGRFAGLIDFLLKNRVALEVNGTFWHADPRSYPDGPIYPSQRRTAEGYARKSRLLRELGYCLVDIWEADIKESLVDAVDGVLRCIGT